MNRIFFANKLLDMHGFFKARFNIIMKKMVGIMKNGWGGWIRTNDHGIKTRCLTAWLRPKSVKLIIMFRASKERLLSPMFANCNRFFIGNRSFCTQPICNPFIIALCAVTVSLLSFIEKWLGLIYISM